MKFKSLPDATILTIQKMKKQTTHFPLNSHSEAVEKNNNLTKPQIWNC
jgi:hypothetical protein